MNKLFSIVALLFFFGLRFGFAENGEEPNQEPLLRRRVGALAVEIARRPPLN